MRLTKIICTLGPSTNNKEGITRLMKEGMNIARLNFSHGSQESQTGVMNTIKECNKNEGTTIGILLDTKGAEIRTGDRAEPLNVKVGDTVVFSHKRTEDEFPIVAVNYPEFADDAKDARFILIDSGELILDIVKIEDDRVVAKSQGDFAIESRRHINLPGADVALPSLAENDWSDIELACKEKLDYIALSFIRNAKELQEVRAFVTKHGHPSIQLISKIENEVAVRNIDEIIEHSDGVMVARGDLGAEIPLETLPAVQDDIVARCRAAGKPVIVATHMLESMIKNPMPTRAEVTDIAHAASTGADSTMLSGETAKGSHPYEAISIMGRILEETEKRVPFVAPTYADTTEDNAHAAAAVSLAHAMSVPAIILFTKTGATAKAVSRLRPSMPVIACTESEEIARAMQILFGVTPVIVPFDKVPEKTITSAFKAIKGRFGLNKGDPVVVLSTIVDAANVRTVQTRLVP